MHTVQPNHQRNTEGEASMTLSIKLFKVRYVLKIFFPPDRRLKWFPAIFWAKVGPATPMEKQA
jgi:hypothetical protein